MRIFTGSVIIGSFMLIGALPAAASQSTVILGSGAPIRLAAASDPSGARDTYTPVSYTHLDVYKRQARGRAAKRAALSLRRCGTGSRRDHDH